MKYILIFFALAAITINAQQTKSKTNIKLALKHDPVCKMEMPKFLKDTVHYQKKIYGVCSSYCKVEIKKNPKKYIR